MYELSCLRHLRVRIGARNLRFAVDLTEIMDVGPRIATTYTNARLVKVLTMRTMIARLSKRVIRRNRMRPFRKSVMIHLVQYFSVIWVSAWMSQLQQCFFW